MKKLYRRSISGLLALLICFTAILGSGVTAFAAASTGETADSYSVAFPRDGDANLDYSGTWGHDELHYMNGWTSGEATWMTTLHTIGSFDGPACYLDMARQVISRLVQKLQRMQVQELSVLHLMLRNNFYRVKDFVKVEGT